MKGRFFRLTLCLVLAFTLLAGCGAKVPKVLSLTITDRVAEQTKEPGPAVQTFPTTAVRFYAVARVSGAVKDTKVHTRWFLEDKLIDETEVVFDKEGTRWVAFSLTTSDGKPFPAGSYKVQVLLDGAAGPEANFKVE